MGEQLTESDVKKIRKKLSTERLLSVKKSWKQ